MVCYPRILLWWICGVNLVPRSQLHVDLLALPNCAMNFCSRISNHSRLVSILRIARIWSSRNRSASSLPMICHRPNCLSSHLTISSPKSLPWLRMFGCELIPFRLWCLWRNLCDLEFLNLKKGFPSLDSFCPNSISTSYLKNNILQKLGSFV